MANINVDTTKMRECGEDIMELSNELGENFEQLFTRLANMPAKTFEWVGSSANNFAITTNIEKSDYVKLKNNIYMLGKHLVESADSLDETIKKSRYSD